MPRKIYSKVLNDIVNLRCPINIKDTKQFKVIENGYLKQYQLF